MITLNAKQLATVLEALNSHEGVLATEYELARANKSDARVSSLAKQMEEARELGQLLQAVQRKQNFKRRMAQPIW